MSLIFHNKTRQAREIYSEHHDEEGFTLLEVMISMVILVFISLGIYQATTETYRLREILANEGDFYNSIRLSMDVFQRDVSLIYSPMILLRAPDPNAPPDPNLTQLLNDGDGSQVSQFWTAVTDRSGIRASHFMGSATKMSFIAASHMRIYKNAPESEFSKISYDLNKDEGNPDVPDAQVLVKSENTDAFNMDDRADTKMSHIYPLLHGIKKLNFRYYRKDKDVWSGSWDSDREDYKNLYPDIIEVTVQIDGPTKLSFDVIFKFRPEIPLHGLDPST